MTPNSCLLCFSTTANLLQISEGSKLFIIIAKLFPILDREIVKDITLCPECLSYAELAQSMKKNIIENFQNIQDNICCICLSNGIIDYSVFPKESAICTEVRNTLNLNFDDGQSPRLCSTCCESVKTITLFRKRYNDNSVKNEKLEDLMTEDMVIFKGSQTLCDPDVKIEIKPELVELDEYKMDLMEELPTLNNIETLQSDKDLLGFKGEIFDIKAEIKHEYNDDKEKHNFKCSKCTYQTKRQADVVRHMLIHNGRYDFKCCKCTFQTNTKYNLDRHMLVHDGKLNFECNMCNFTTKRKYELNSHMIVHDGNYDFKCSKCNFQAKRKNHLVSHMLTHTERYDFKCKNCNYQSKTKASLIRHMIVHNADYYFKCNKCTYQTKRKADLVAHMLVHDEKYDFKCDKCNYQTTKSTYLRKHMAIHVEKYDFKCSKCSYEAKRKSQLVRHMITHEEKYDFKCSKCNFQAKGKYNLTRHMKSNHVDSK